MVNPNGLRHRAILQMIARRAMLERGLLPDFSPEALRELSRINRPGDKAVEPARDLRDLPWASIDNDDSLDLDQITVAEEMRGGMVRVLVAIADVDALVESGSAIDDHAHHNTTSVYTGARTFAMLPEKLSNDLTSLKFDEDRPAIVIEMVVDGDGALQSSDVYGAMVRNHAKLAYNNVAAWLENQGPLPEAIARVGGLEANLLIQDRVARALKELRHEYGALDLDTIQSRPVFAGEQILDLERESRNRAKEIIEDFMIAANGVVARFLETRKYPSLRRVVRRPKRWSRIVGLASDYGYRLPEEPDSKALSGFLANQRAADPVAFPDLSLSVIKLLGAGEYVVEYPGQKPPGHFGLAVRDYTHSTAPNRRFPDLVTQRIVKASLAGLVAPYSPDELTELARHCTDKEDDAEKVERLVRKSAAALLLASRIGEQFDAIVTGASEKGTWVRTLRPPVEGRLLHGFEGVDVGRRLRVELIHTDVERGYIDFKRAH
jgi:VacB/RNase II family 3'-5' exoribonuclease